MNTTAREAGRVEGDFLAEERIRQRMETLLGLAGLGYQGGFVTVGGRAVHYLDYGPFEASTADSSPPILLLHGAGAGSAIWYRQIASLARTRRVIAPDHPGFGLSDAPDLSTSLPEFMTGYLAGFLDALAVDRVDVAGLSLGGYAAMLMAIYLPERVRRLAIIDSAGLGRHLPWIFRVLGMPMGADIFRWAARRFKGLLRLVMQRTFEKSEVAHPELPDAQDVEEYAYEVASAEKYGVIVSEGVTRVASLSGQMIVLSREELSSIPVPSLIIWGAKDAFFPVSHARRAHRHIPDTRLEVLADAGHVATFDKPERVASLLEDFFRPGL